MTKNKKIIIGILLVCLTVISGFALYSYFQQKKMEANPVVAIAKEHLEKYVHHAFPNVDFFSMVKKVEVVEEECEANHYWENWGQPSIKSPPCEEGFIFSQKDCSCVRDPFGCDGLDKESCELNPNCFSFSRGGTCSCPNCEIYLSHQCLPIESPSKHEKHECWIVKFYYLGPAEGSHLVVYVDKNTNEVIGGTQTR